MSSDVCRACKNFGTCTFPRNQIIVQCEEYEYANPRAARDGSDRLMMPQALATKTRTADAVRASRA